MGWQPGPGKPLGKAVRLSRACPQQPAQWAIVRFPGTAQRGGEQQSQRAARAREGAALRGWQRGAWEADQPNSASWDPASPSADTGSFCE